ncbi:MAG: T9SS type A sorting domain-containing protein [Patescibacteria group bacterium]
MKRLLILFVFLFVTNIFSQDTGYIPFGTSNATGGASFSSYNLVNTYLFSGSIAINYPQTGDVPYVKLRKPLVVQNMPVQTQLKIRAACPSSSLKMKMGIGFFNSTGIEGTSGLVELSNNGIVTDYSVNVFSAAAFNADQLKISFSQSPGQAAGNFSVYILGIWRVTGSTETPIDIPQGGTGITPGVPVLTTPLDGATSFALNGGTLNWNAVSPVAGGIITYSVQVSTNQAFSSFVTNQNVTGVTSVTLNNLVANTIYYWRVSASENGQTSAYSSTRSFSTGTGTVIPDAPTLGAPADGTTNFPLSGGTLNYTPVNGISGYQLELRENSQTGTLVNNLVYTSSPITLNNLKSNQTYWWRLGSIGANSIGWSQWRSFTTINPIPDAPTLGAPTNGATGLPINGDILTFTLVSGISGYQLELREGSQTGPLVNNLVYTASPITLSGLKYSTVYWWRLGSVGTNGIGWSQWRSFTTVNNIITIAKPIHLSPANNSSGMVTPISFVWTAVSGVMNYELQISKVSTFLNLEYAATPPQNYQNVSILYASTLYYWRVRGIGSAGVVGEWSDPWTFMIGSTTGVDDQNKIPTQFALMQNYPNPFNPVTSIKYEVSSIEHVNITVYDILGREIVPLVNEQKTPGRYEARFDGSKLTSGMYVYTIRAGNFSATKKMILMK